MEKLDKNINKYTKCDIEYNLKIEYSKALEDPYFKKITDKLNQKSEILMKYTSKIKDSAEECKKCKGCKGLFECKNKVPGYIYSPIIKENRIQFIYKGCKYTIKDYENTKFQKNVYLYEMPKEILNARMKDIDTCDSNRVEVIKWIVNYAKENKKTKGLYLNGNFGCGKTYLISALFNELAKKNEKVAIVYWPEFLRNIKSLFKEGYEKKFNRIKKTTYLLIDDIGAENSTEWARDEILGPILQYRMQEKLPTFFTSNFTIEELEIHLSNGKVKTEKVKARRIIERIKQLTENINLISENKRK